MKFLTSVITIISEFAGLILSVVWYINTKEIEPLIVIISLSGLLIVSAVSKFTVRPKLVLHRKPKDRQRIPKGYTKHYPVIRLGIDNPEYFWELGWHYNLEIRNNSSLTAYNVRIKYINIPD